MSFRASRLVLAMVLVLVLTAAPASAGLLGGSTAKADKPAAGVAGNLAVIDLRVHEITTGAGEPRLAIQVLVENQSPVNRTGPFEIDVRVKDARQSLGTCRGELLPQGQVALCELWLTEGTRQGQVFEATLNRSVGDFGAWDGDTNDDRRTHEVRTVAEGNQVLRLASFEVSPQTIQGSSDVQFRFQVEGGHLVWLIAEDRAPRLLAGHPADGLLNGKGKERIGSSGPITLVARNSFGAFVYTTIPVLNLYEQAPPQWARVPAQEVDGVQVVKVLDPGVYDIDEDQVILERLRAYLGTKDWVADLNRMRAALDQENGKPTPASVLNPKTRKPEPAPVPTPAPKKKKK